MSSLISFNADTSVTIISHDNRRWLTAEDIGRCLGFAEGNERTGVIRAYHRHNDEFTAEDSTVVKLTTVDSKLRDVRIFSETGCIKLGFFCNTHHAKAFRKWAAKVLAGEIKPHSQVQTEQIAALQSAFLQFAPREAQIIRYHQMGLGLSEIGRLVNLAAGSVANRLKHLTELGFVNYQPDPALSERSKRAHAKMLELKQVQQSLDLEG